MRDHWSLIAALACFALFIANVIAGAFSSAAFLSDVGEMLSLFCACIFFVVFVLKRERMTQSLAKQNHQ